MQGVRYEDDMRVAEAETEDMASKMWIENGFEVDRRKKGENGGALTRALTLTLTLTLTLMLRRVGTLKKSGLVGCPMQAQRGLTIVVSRTGKMNWHHATDDAREGTLPPLALNST